MRLTSQNMESYYSPKITRLGFALCRFPREPLVALGPFEDLGFPFDPFEVLLPLAPFEVFFPTALFEIFLPTAPFEILPPLALLRNLILDLLP